MKLIWLAIILSLYGKELLVEVLEGTYKSIQDYNKNNIPFSYRKIPKTNERIEAINNNK